MRETIIKPGDLEYMQALDAIKKTFPKNSRYGDLMVCDKAHLVAIIIHHEGQIKQLQQDAGNPDMA